MNQCMFIIIEHQKLWKIQNPDPKLQATLRALVPDFLSLEQLAVKLNSIFYRDSLPNRFASLIYLEINSDSNEIRTVNAGHIPPIITGQGKLSEMDKGSPALGIMADSTYREERIRLNKRELFIAYSDGVTEARNDAGEFFGESRLKELLANTEGLNATNVGKKILEHVDNFIGDARATDDLSMIIIRRLD